MSNIIKKPPIIFLMGSTASGKTELAAQLVESFPLDIISVDSVQIYRDMDIGTAKPGAMLLARAPHRLINIRDPIDSYSAAEFRSDALAAITQINAAGRIPLLVGGTGLYFRALRYGLSQLPPANPTLRAQLEQEAAIRGWDALHADLAFVDPIAAARIHPHDTQRIQRALEVWNLTKRSLSSQQQGRNNTALPYRVLVLARAPRAREVLRQRIATRFLTMLANGLEQEVQNLLDRWQLSLATPASRSVGYRQVIQYLLGKYDKDEMIKLGITATHGLAKRQLTWLRSEPDINWIYDEDGDPWTTARQHVINWL